MQVNTLSDSNKTVNEQLLVASQRLNNKFDFSKDALTEVDYKKHISEADVDAYFATFIENFTRYSDPNELQLIKKAYKFAKEAHRNSIRYTGDAYIHHVFEVARIVTHDIGLGATGAIAALLHEVPSETDYNVEDIRNMFGNKIADIVQALVQIKGTSALFVETEPDVYNKVIMGLGQDIRVILIKLADRIHNMRTINHLPPVKQQKIAREVMYVYVPLSYQLGLSKIKTTLEDLAFKYLNPTEYFNIFKLLQNDETKWRAHLNRFTFPILHKLSEVYTSFDIKGRQKSIFSIYSKMQKKNINFTEVYDKYAIRIIFTPLDIQNEKEEVFSIVKMIKEIYEVHPDRTRNWITQPKDNGYEAYHLTVFDPKIGNWVEIQIRTERMHEIAEIGLAAHWKYKGVADKKNIFESKIKVLKERLENPVNNSFEFIDDLKILFTNEIIVYTSENKKITLSTKATVLDFAYMFNPQQAYHCIGAVVNHKPVDLNTTLKSGDRVEILTSQHQHPQPEWLNIVKTKTAFKILKEQFKQFNGSDILEGQKIVNKIGMDLNIDPSDDLYTLLLKHFKIKSKNELFKQIGAQKISADELHKIMRKAPLRRIVDFWQLQFLKTNAKSNDNSDLNVLITNPRINKLKYQMAECCNPVPGDKVIGLITDKRSLFIHKINCIQATIMRKETPEIIVPVTWKNQKMITLPHKITIKGLDKKGILQKIVTLLSKNFDLNIKSLHFDSIGDEFEGSIEIFVQNENVLKKIIDVINKLDGVLNVSYTRDN